MHKHH